MMDLPDVTLWDTVTEDHAHVWDNVNAFGREAMVGFINSGDSVLDVGCGNGFVYLKAKEKGYELPKYVGIDISNKFLTAARELSPEGDWRRMSAENLEFEDESYDVVILMHVLETLNGYEKALEEALRVAKKRVIVCFWKAFKTDDNGEDNIKEHEEYLGWESVYSKSKWFKWMENRGFPTAPWVELHAEGHHTNLFFVLDKRHYNQSKPKTKDRPNEYTDVKREQQEPELTWNPPVDNSEEAPQSYDDQEAATKTEAVEEDPKPTILDEIIVDSDDLEDDKDPYDFLLTVKKRFPNFKITMFYAPKNCSKEMIEKYKALDWVELGVHGYVHEPNTEFQDLNYEDVDMRMMAAQALHPETPHVFKAPGWQISDDGLKWFADNDWTIMDQHYNNDHRPEGLMTVVYNDADDYIKGAGTKTLHTHTWDCCGNWIEDALRDPPFDENTKFSFVSEAAKPWSKSSS